MRLLSFDTSSREITVALLMDGREPAVKKIIFEADLEIKSSGKKVSRQESVSLLIPTIDDLLKENSLPKSELEALAVGIGPGGFTGIRVAVATARTIAQALKLPLLGINSLEVMSYPISETLTGELAGVLKHASASHCFAAVYRRVALSEDEYDLVAEVEPSYVRYDQFEDFLKGTGCTSLWYAEEPCLARLSELPHGDVEFRSLGANNGEVENITVTNVALIQAKLAHSRLSLRNGKHEYSDVEPLYLRGASVTLKKGDAVERIESN